MEQQSEVEVLQSICGEDCLLLAPVLGRAAHSLVDSYSPDSSSNSYATGLGTATDCPQLDMAALNRGEQMQLQVAIRVQVPSEGIRLQECQDQDDRSSGASVDSSVTIRHLPPLCLRLTFPSDYPNSVPPVFQLTALWLSASHTDVLSAELSAQWEAQGPGMPICYSWIEWLQSSCLEAIGVTTHFNLTQLVDSGCCADSTTPGQQGQGRNGDDHTHHHEGFSGPASDQRHTVPCNGSMTSSTSSSCFALPCQQSQLLGGQPTLSASEHSEDSGASGDDEALVGPGISDVHEMMAKLAQFDASRDFMLFLQTSHLCPVCYEDTPGRHCMRLEGCSHTFCVECVTTHARMHVTEGSLDRLQCLHGTCLNVLSAQDLDRVLSPEEVQRMEALRLQRALDQMADIVYCPRCQSPTLEDSDGSHCSQCAKCFFVFCSLCNYAYHPSKKCMTAEDALKIHRLRMAGCRNGLGAELRMKAERMEEDIKSSATVEETSKQCPRCSIATQKSGGCNKMTCTRCHVKWCYKCGEAISGYDHFGANSCVLFNDADIALWNLEMAGVPPNELRNVAHADGGRPERNQARPLDLRSCPMCRTHVPRIQNNNHMMCWSCGMPFCGCCRGMLRHEGSAHFSNSKTAAKAGRCRQHTTH